MIDLLALADRLENEAIREEAVDPFMVNLRDAALMLRRVQTVITVIHDERARHQSNSSVWEPMTALQLGHDLEQLLQPPSGDQQMTERHEIPADRETLERIRRESVPADRAVWQPDNAKSYRCPKCLRWLFTQYTGDVLPSIACRGPLEPHILEWEETIITIAKVTAKAEG